MPAGTSQSGGVKDALLYGLAVKVAEHHQPDPEQPDRCGNLRCAGESYPCTAARDAARAEMLATGGPNAVSAPAGPAGTEPDSQVRQRAAGPALPARQQPAGAPDPAAARRSTAAQAA